MWYDKTKLKGSIVKRLKSIRMIMREARIPVSKQVQDIVRSKSDIDLPTVNRLIKNSILDRNYGEDG